MSQVLPEHVLKRMSAADRSQLGKAGRTMAEAAEVFCFKSERDLQKHINRELNRRNIPFIYSRSDRRTTNTKGTPDFVFPLRGLFGRYGFIEVKFGSGKPSKEQTELIESLLANGAIGIVTKSFVEVKEFLDLHS